MKNTIKILILALIVLFTVGITTSKAYKVGANTSASTMVSNLNSGLQIDNIVRRQNNNVFCRDWGTKLSISNYTRDYYKVYTSNPKSSAYTGTTQDLRIAYILSSNYSKDAKQQAYWWALGQKYSSAPNELARNASSYATFIQNNKNVGVTINKTNAVTTYDGDTKIYGPISISYPYNSTWGGLKYKFVDPNNNNQNVNNTVSLCIKQNETYTPISNTDGGNGYRSASIDCNGKDIYVVTNSDLFRVKLEVSSWITYCTAEVYHIKGSTDKGWEYKAYCVDCVDYLLSSKTIINEINTASSKDKDTKVGTFFHDLEGMGGQRYQFYILDHIETNSQSYDNYNVFRLYDTDWGNWNDYPADYHPAEIRGYECEGCHKKIVANHFSTHIKEANIDDHISLKTETTLKCKYCQNYRINIPDGDVNAAYKKLANHYQQNHSFTYYNQKIYVYKTWNGYGHNCGYWHSGSEQKLSIL